jgi:ABC-type nickel/cobalt efflux system permease component RcnA
MIVPFSGLIAGTLHVWAGPDHLAAIAPLAVRQPARAWLPGIRWGIGHSAGVALVGLLALLLRDLLPLNLLSSWGERLVGVLLIGIGLWAFHKALQHRVHAHSHEHDGEKHVHLHIHPRSTGHEKNTAHRHTHAALGIGILHGLAGSSHLLGVLPMLALPTKFQAGLYLAAFALGTILSMATFSSIVGFFARRCAVAGDKIYRGLMGCCATAAVVIGIVWLVMSLPGGSE